VAFGERAVPYLGTLLGAVHGDTRFYAVLVAGELSHPDLVEPLAKLVFDPDPGVRELALAVLPRFARFSEPYERMLEAFRVHGRVPRKIPEHRLQAVVALGDLRDASAVEPLVRLLEDDETPIAEAAHRSLVLITRQDFGGSVKRWSSWLEKNQGRHRVEWLIDALNHSDEELRAAAGEELQKLTQQYVGYHPHLGKREREVAQRRYREWWETEGATRF
jgi:HEAT repeat protein